MRRLPICVLGWHIGSNNVANFIANAGTYESAVAGAVFVAHIAAFWHTHAATFTASFSGSDAGANSWPHPSSDNQCSYTTAHKYPHTRANNCHFRSL
jgi:hypothetical protein